MFVHHPAARRGLSRRGRVESRHSFTFGYFYDPARLGFRSMRVLNDDLLPPGEGLPPEERHDLEIVSYVVSGEIEHRDSAGFSARLGPGDAQRLTTGRGMSHSEDNASWTDRARVVHAWFKAAADGLGPDYQSQRFAPEARRDRLVTLAARDGRGGSMRVHQDVAVHVVALSARASVQHALPAGWHAWVQVIAGEVGVMARPSGERVRLAEGDGLAVSDESALLLVGFREAEALVIDLA